MDNLRDENIGVVLTRIELGQASLIEIMKHLVDEGVLEEDEMGPLNAIYAVYMDPNRYAMGTPVPAFKASIKE